MKNQIPKNICAIVAGIKEEFHMERNNNSIIQTIFMKFYELIKQPLNEVEEYLEEILSQHDSYMYPLLVEYLKRGGKRLRPALVLLTIGALNGEIKDGIKPATILEMFHNFTLVHDDIEDDSEMRRGKPTMHIAQGIPIAINTGDALYTLVWKSLFELDIPLEKKNIIGILFSNAFKKVVEGQARELKWYKEHTLDISEKQYFDMIGGKTGSLIQASCELGSFLSPDQRFKKQLSDYGMNIGIAFQIQDDILNLIGKEEEYKKEIGGDITEGKRTLMLVHALRNLEKKEENELKGIILSSTRNKEEINKAIELITDSGGIKHAKEKTIYLVNAAKKNLEVLEDSEYSSALLELADFVMKRSH